MASIIVKNHQKQRPTRLKNSSFLSINKNEQSIDSLKDASSKQKKVSHRYLYFHGDTGINRDEKMSFPYNAYSLCYFQNKLDASRLRRSKIKDLNSNTQIRNFLNTKLKTEPISHQIKSIQKLKDISFVKEDKNKSKCLQFPNEIISENKIHHISLNYSPCNKKFIKQKKFANVFKIKSKKEYFLNKFKKVSNKDVLILNPENQMKISKQNYFELKYRSKTQDHKTIVDLIKNRNSFLQSNRSHQSNQISSKQAFQNLRSIEYNQSKEYTLDPWQSNALQVQSKDQLQQMG